jgi:TM2 domain-containing membrane protein YozV
MNKKAVTASFLSAVIPGLGQIYSGRGSRGAILLLAAILVGNLNALWLSLYALTTPSVNALWTNMLPRILHDICAAWSVAFYLWQVVDAYEYEK